jgi:S-adenosylmethionine:tRNA-ribosyltransferase-isomerase (queuine synthetase)
VRERVTVEKSTTKSRKAHLYKLRERDNVLRLVSVNSPNADKATGARRGRGKVLLLKYVLRESPKTHESSFSKIAHSSAIPTARIPQKQELYTCGKAKGRSKRSVSAHSGCDGGWNERHGFKD